MKLSESEFKASIGRARQMGELFADDWRGPYFAGYQRGLRRLFHGEKFGTQAEHEQWSSLSQVPQGEDYERHWKGIGYRMGLNHGRLRMREPRVKGSAPPEFMDETGVLTTAEGIKRLRRIMNWNTAQLAEHLGCSPRTVEGWEQGRRPDEAYLYVLRELLD